MSQEKGHLLVIIATVFSSMVGASGVYFQWLDHNAKQPASVIQTVAPTVSPPPVTPVSEEPVFMSVNGSEQQLPPQNVESIDASNTQKSANSVSESEPVVIPNVPEITETHQQGVVQEKNTIEDAKRIDVSSKVKEILPANASRVVEPQLIKVSSINSQLDGNSIKLDWMAANKSGVLLGTVQFKAVFYDDLNYYGKVIAEYNSKQFEKPLGPCGSLPYRARFPLPINMKSVRIEALMAKPLAAAQTEAVMLCH